MNASTTLKKFGLEQAFNYLYKDPDKNLVKIMDWADKFAGGEFVAQRAAIRQAITDPAHPYYPFIRRLFQDVDPDVMKTIAVNFFINANGDVDPCVFVHYSDSNIREKTLLECLQSPIFMAYHDGQPFNDNMLRPCPMLENPEKLREMVAKSGAHSTDLQSPESVEHLCAKCGRYAEHWAPVAEELWRKSQAEKEKRQ